MSGYNHCLVLVHLAAPSPVAVLTTSTTKANCSSSLDAEIILCVGRGAKLLV